MTCLYPVINLSSWWLALVKGNICENFGNNNIFMRQTKIILGTSGTMV